MSKETPSKLERYREKRSPDRTPEPFGGPSRPGGRTFVVHQHAARNLHWDLRLELDGVLKSWAVPKGPSTHVEEKRLAVHVEDHPLEYGDFEGVIPPGNYGAGSVIIWDRGWYRSFKPEDLMEQYQRGKLELELFGYKLRGRWTLVRMGKKEKEWLLLKKAGAGSSERELIERYPESVVTGMTVEQNADVAQHRASVREHIAGYGAPSRDVPLRGQALMLATLVEQPFDGKDWIYEIKYDGVRVLARRQGGDVEILGRSGAPVASRYPEIAAALLKLPCSDYLIDGEIVAPDESGQPSFQRLQARMHLTNPHDIARAGTSVPVTAIFFDALAAEGFDLRKVPLLDRKECLRRILPPLGPVRYGDHVAEHGVRIYEAASAMRLEGIVAKKAASLYVPGRSRDWLKVKCQRRQEFVVGGWTDPQGSRGHFGALLIGLYRGDSLVYVTRVGSGFDQKLLRTIWERLEAAKRETTPFAERSPQGRENHWAEPRLVAEVRFTEWTQDGGLRHPTFLGLRDDKKPRECVFEEAVSLAGAAAADADAGPAEAEDGAPRAAAPRARAQASERVVKLTNLHKIFWPAERYTKGDLIAYYDAVAPLILPYLEDRPIFVTRFPDGIEGKSFYQKDAPEFAPDWVRRELIFSGDQKREIRYFVVDDRETLRYVINSGVIPIHPWSSRIGSLEQPDWMIIDLDPKGAPFAHVIRVALTLKRVLDDLEIPGYVKTSGATGLHVLVPLGARYTYEQSRTFARLIAMIVVQEEREIATVIRSVQSRGGKVYVDYGQNAHGQTIVSPFCVRAVPGAQVSCPLVWDEVDAKLDPARYTIRTVPPRFEKMKDPLRPVLGPGIDMIEAIGKLAAMFPALDPGEEEAAPAPVAEPPAARAAKGGKEAAQKGPAPGRSKPKRRGGVRAPKVSGGQ